MRYNGRHHMFFLRMPALPWAAGAILCLISIPLACALGPIDIHVADTARALLHLLGLAGLPQSVTATLPGGGVRELDGAALSAVICTMRLPRVILALAAGAGLAVAGAVFQAILRNPLADPFTLGVSSGAAFGASLVISLGFTTAALGFGLPLAAFAGAAASLAAVFFLSRVSGGLKRDTLILSGVVVSAFLAALIALVKALDESSVTGIVFWIMGSFQGRGAPELRLLLPGTLFGLCLCMLVARQLDMLFLGDDTARLLGLGAARMRLFMLLVSGLITASCVAVSGIIGFVGLIVPHLCRMLFGAAHRRLLPACALYGGLLLLWSDTAARTLLPGGVELPVGVITAMLGGPFFCFVLGKKRQPAALPDALPCDVPGEPGTRQVAQERPPAQGPHIACEGLLFRYGAHHSGPDGKAAPVLDGIDLYVARGEHVALLGPNGSGKSTLLRCLAGLARPQRGRALIDGHFIATLSEKERALLLSSLPQRPEEIPPLPVFELVLMGRYAHTSFLGSYSQADKAAAMRALVETGAAGMAARPASRLSGGELQRVLLARALAGEAPLLLLDEATAGLDPRYQSAVLDVIAGRGPDLTVFSIMHDINLAALYYPRLVFLKQGRIVADGAPRQVFTPDVLRAVYDAEFVVFTHPESGAPQALPTRNHHGGCQI